VALTDSLISYWALDEASGSRVDSHGTNDLTDNNTVGSTTGILSTAGDFVAANNEYLSHASNSDLVVGDEDFTLMAWIYVTATFGGVQRRIVSKRSANNNCDYDLSASAATDCSPVFEIRNSAGSGVSLTYTPALAFDAWHLIFAWHDSVNDLIYVQADNGTPDSAATGGIVPGGSGEFRIGQLAQVSRPWDDLIDEVGFWKRVLTSDERTELWNGGAGRDYAYISGGAAAENAAIRRFLRRGDLWLPQHRPIEVGRQGVIVI
jgi:hypothetical protein